MSELLDILPNAEPAFKAMPNSLKRLRNNLYQYCKISDYSTTGGVQSQSIITTPVLKVPEGCWWTQCTCRYRLWSDELYNSETVSLTTYPGHKYHAGTSCHFICSLPTEKERKPFSLNYSCMYKQTSDNPNPINVPLLHLFRSHNRHLTADIKHP